MMLASARQTDAVLLQVCSVHCRREGGMPSRSSLVPPSLWTLRGTLRGYGESLSSRRSQEEGWMEPGGGARVRGVGVQQGSVGQVLLRGSVAAGLPSVLERARHRAYAAHSGARPSPWGPCPAAPTAYRDHGRTGLGGFVLRVGPGHRWRQHAARPVANPRRPTKPSGEYYRDHTAAGHHTDFQPPVTPAKPVAAI